tara:strand:+ start:154 stop:309 length:156 start_codon:yes stop_codon:yes gene_type:complete
MKCPKCNKKMDIESEGMTDWTWFKTYKCCGKTHTEKVKEKGYAKKRWMENK